MEIRSFSDSIKKTLAATLIAGTALSFSSCDRIHEDLQPCPQGVRLRFVYDYNMEFANAFPSQVDCLTVLFYDEEGNYVTTRTNMTESDLSDENWRMTVDLEPGSYNIIAYGGMECQESSFMFNSSPSQTLMESLEVYLPADMITEPVGKEFHHLFYGRLAVTIPENSTDYTEATVEMMKDTNDIRILLANENGVPTNADDFIFTITDNNTRFNYLNDVVSTEMVTYYPWDKGNSEVGMLPNGADATLSWANFRVPRLIKDASATFTICKASDGSKVFSIPLVNLLLEYKIESGKFRDMGPQEFLDRENRWVITVILSGDTPWTRVTIVIEDWMVRINNTTF